MYKCEWYGAECHGMLLFYPRRRQNMEDLNALVGRSQKRTDDATAAPIARLNAMLDRQESDPLPGSEVPPLGHWLYFSPQARQSDIGPDGFAKRGELLSGVDLPLRIWTGGDVDFLHPLHVEDEMVCQSQVEDVRPLDGDVDGIVVQVVRELSNAQGIAVREACSTTFMRQKLLEGFSNQRKPSPKDETFSRKIVPDPVLLFRFSALTFDGNRLHFDRTYAMQTEKLPGLLVQGRLIAALMTDMLRNHFVGGHIVRLGFKAGFPVFDDHAFEVCGKAQVDLVTGDQRVHLWARSHDGLLAMSANAVVAFPLA